MLGICFMVPAQGCTKIFAVWLSMIFVQLPVYPS